MITLRPYQEKVKAAIYEHLRNRNDNPCAVVPTGGGKSPVMSSICKDAVNIWDGRVLILAHVKELLEQTADKLRQVCPELNFGVYSAGLRRRDTDNKVIVAGIQSVYKLACQLDAFDLILVDEAHLIPKDGDGMYRRYLADAKVINPDVRIVGFTATPFRLKQGPICTPDGLLNHVCIEIGVRELIRDGFLCPLITRSGNHNPDLSAIQVREGEFVANELETLMSDDGLVQAACDEIVEYSAKRKARLIFASGIKHGRLIVDTLAAREIECGFVHSDMSARDRENILSRFRDRSLQYLCNVNILTTGFDVPHIDCVAIVRPTMSPGLYYQMVGRGFRLHDSKQNCLILDFGGNIERHGPVDDLRITRPSSRNGTVPTKRCPHCDCSIATGYAHCPQCGHAFPPPEEAKHEAQSTTAGILSGQVTDTEHIVRDIKYSVHAKRGADETAPRTMQVEYRLGLNHYQSDYICLEHSGYARHRAIMWWTRRSHLPVPDCIERAVEIANAGGLAYAERITVRAVAGERFESVIAHVLGPIPIPSDIKNETEVPF